MPAPAQGFGEAAEAWLGGVGRLRDAVRQTLVAHQLDAELAARFPVGRRLRVLDVGVGQGTQAVRLARMGHEVTGIDLDPRMLEAARDALAAEPVDVRGRVRLLAGDARETGARFAPGSFDAVLCHGVLMYVEEPGPLLAGLARVLARGGLLSLVVRNADALALRPGLSGDWEAALAAFDDPHYTNRLGVAARADRLSTLTAALAGTGAPLRAWYGVRLFTDLAPDEAEPPSGEELERLLAAEERAGRTDPYRGVAALLHVCATRD
ncbi:bifunctional 2-polyprenyl-6-hydroxyphenol methylase/3-demethylubiquinol 3-O-methyltransferase UbiG [Streptomyces sp. JJ38]|uniref:class I SAM-dependent methyltransferase n=1 Tax=Streptomyces sp. JJ38 TaxID=2738128 RepID=UPI001C5637D0|nr:class I SAM-dependent methyltransferase [Streptomyces sp. JJ38]MBW1599183.1 methyltransferase domain-containing protein [Streptomyces sp. JJ38]